MPFRIPFATGAARAFSYDQNELAQITGAETEPTGVLYNVGKFLSRPLYAVTSLLSGEPGDALENAVQMALDFPTGGFLNRNWSLANMFSDTGDITTRAERPEVSDVFRSWGMGRAEGGSKFAIDFIGGMLLDPLTYVTLGTSALAKGSLSSMGRVAAAEKVMGQLVRTPLGKEAFEAALAGVKGQRGALEATSLGFAARADRFSKVKAVEQVFEDALKRTDEYADAFGDAGFFFNRATKQDGILNAGIAALERAGQMKKHGKLRIHGPLGFGPGFDVVDFNFGLLGRATLPALAYKVLYRFDATKPTAEMAQTAATEGWEWLRKTFYDKTLSRHASAGAMDDVRAGAYKRVRGDVEGHQLVNRIWTEPLTATHRATIAKEWDRVGQRFAEYKADPTKFASDYRDQMLTEWVPPLSANPATRQPWTRQEYRQADLAGRNVPRLPPQRQIAAVEEAIWPAGELNAPKARELLEQNALDAIRGLHPELDMGVVKNSLAEYDKSLKLMPKALERLGVWKHSKGREFYVPHQATQILSDLIHKSYGNGGKEVREGLKSVFELGRRHDTPEFVEALKKLADKSGIELEDVVEWDIGALHLKRLQSHNQTVFRRTLMDQAKRFHGYDTDKNIQTYINAQFGDVGMRPNVLMRIIGGGLLPVKNSLAIKEGMTLQQLDDVAKKNGWVLKDGKVWRRWRGLNYFFKPALTSNPQNIGFHVRNAYSAVLMGLFDPDIGWAGTRAILDTLRDAPVIQRLTGWGPSETGTFLRAMNGSESALAALAGKKVGNYDAVEVVAQLKGFLGNRISSADLMNSIRNDVLGREAATKNRFFRGLEDVFTEAGAAPLGAAKAGVPGRGAGFVPGSAGQFPPQASATVRGGGGQLPPSGAVPSDYASTVPDRIADHKRTLREELMQRPAGPSWRGRDRQAARVAAPTPGAPRRPAAAPAGPAAAAAPNEQGLWDAWVSMGEKISNHVEGTFRANAYLTLVRKGVNPTEAAARVEKAFVKYSVNSEFERGLRDIFPFARFMIGSTAWLGSMAQAPYKMLTPIARAQGSIQDDQQILPATVRGGIGIPMWRDHDGNMQYLTSLGLPQEAAMGVLDAVTSFEGLRRSGLGALHPLAKYPLEQAVNRNMFFGGEAGAYRRKPGWLPGGVPLLTEKITRPGGEVTYESPGWLNDLLGAQPASRALKIFDTALDGRKGPIDRLIRLVTGARTVTVDQRRATAEVLEKWLESKVGTGEAGKINAYFSRFDEANTPPELLTVLRSLNAFRSEKKRERKLKQR
jgi:hypothetical protein